MEVNDIIHDSHLSVWGLKTRRAKIRYFFSPFTVKTGHCGKWRTQRTANLSLNIAFPNEPQNEPQNEPHLRICIFCLFLKLEPQSCVDIFPQHKFTCTDCPATVLIQIIEIVWFINPPLAICINLTLRHVKLYDYAEKHSCAHVMIIPYESGIHLQIDRPPLPR